MWSFRYVAKPCFEMDSASLERRSLGSASCTCMSKTVPCEPNDDWSFLPRSWHCSEQVPVLARSASAAISRAADPMCSSLEAMRSVTADLGMQCRCKQLGKGLFGAT